MELATPGNLAKSAVARMRQSTRRPLVVRGRVSWKDQHGTTRYADVTTKNLSEDSVYVEWNEPTEIAMYRLVYVQVSADARHLPDLPEALRHGRALSVVSRVGERRRETGAPSGFALKFLVAPRKKARLRLHDRQDIA